MSKNRSKKTSNTTNNKATPENKETTVKENEVISSSDSSEVSEEKVIEAEDKPAEKKVNEPEEKSEEKTEEKSDGKTDEPEEKVNVAATEFILNEAEKPTIINNKHTKKSSEAKKTVENQYQKNTLNSGINNKTFFIKYAYFLGVLVVVFGILIYSVVLSRRSWVNNLRTSVEKVLNENEPDMWAVGKVRNIENPFSLNCVCYESRYKKTGENFTVVLIRVSTLYGPLPAVFLYDDNENVSFVGYSSLHGRISNQIKNHPSDKRINYWKKKIPEIIR